MDLIRLREAERRDYRDPVPFLRELRDIELLMKGTTTPSVRALRTNKLREFREARVGALFCHGLSERIGRKVYFSKGEFEDADFVASWIEGAVRHFSPVQIKELVPGDSNASAATFDTLVHALSPKYIGTKDLTVLIYVNRRMHFDPISITLPSQLPIAALWVIACIDPAQEKWAIWGNLLEEKEGTSFTYPV